MKKLIALALVCGAATTSWGRQPILVPAAAEPVLYQAGQYSPQPTPATPIPAPPSPGTIPGDPSTLRPIPQTVVPGPMPGASIEPGTIVCDASAAPLIPLYPKVKVIQARNMADCPVSKIVAVPDPCNPCQCVFVAICVPACACERVYCSPHKDRVVFDYGKYAVKVTNRHGTLFVNYDD